MTICEVCHCLTNESALGQFMDGGEIVMAHLACAQQRGLCAVGEDETEIIDPTDLYTNDECDE